MLRLRQAAARKPRITSCGPLLLLVGLSLQAQCYGAERQPASTSPPLPVPRPRFDNPALNASPTPPATSSAAPAGSVMPGAAPADAPRPTPSAGTPAAPPVHNPLLRLNDYPREEQRAILRRCAADWERMKREGTIGGLIWRDFLDTCLPDH
jgi:hypothetical protein